VRGAHEEVENLSNSPVRRKLRKSPPDAARRASRFDASNAVDFLSHFSGSPLEVAETSA
jgi:hypothetical protein